MKFVVATSTFSGDQRIDIDEKRFNEVKKAKADAIFALDIEEKLALLLDNFSEFEVELLKLAEAMLIWPNRNLADSMRDRLSLDRRLVNLLTASRLYLDQTDHGISAMVGDASRELKHIKKFKNDLYDNNFGYALPTDFLEYSDALRESNRANRNVGAAFPSKMDRTKA